MPDSVKVPAVCHVPIRIPALLLPSDEDIVVPFTVLPVASKSWLLFMPGMKLISRSSLFTIDITGVTGLFIKVLNFSFFNRILLLFLILLIPLTSCFQRNEIFEHNKRILDENYEVNANYAVVTGRTYQTKDRTIDFGNLIDKQIRRDGKGVEVIYNTRFTSTLVEDNIYFFYEYKRSEDIGKFAVGYVDLVTLKVYADYFEYERSGLSWEYLYSTDEFVAYKFYEYDGIKDIKIVFGFTNV